jgi:hypothetical protein
MKSKPTPEFEEGPQAATRFQRAMKTIIAVPRSEIQRRETEYQKQAALNPRRRGPKRKVNQSASPDLGDA